MATIIEVEVCIDEYSHEISNNALKKEDLIDLICLKYNILDSDKIKEFFKSIE